MINKNGKHKKILEANKEYYYEPYNKNTISLKKEDVKLVAFYLPQFHSIKQNDLAWGQGFTEWVNVKSAKPRFIGHRQPLEPGDLGYYDLTDETTIERQIKIAKHYGIGAFCFYYYWFSGEKVLDKPLKILLKHKEWNFNFMICWANENWTKKWDGRDNEIILAQEYLEEDPLNFIKDVEHILIDPRYLRKNGRPILAIYRGSELKKPKKAIAIWRKYFLDKYRTELEIITMLHFDSTDPKLDGFDAGVEFSPFTEFNKRGFNNNDARYPLDSSEIMDNKFTADIYKYGYFIDGHDNISEFNFKTYKCISPGWDNDARRKGKGSFILHGSNPDHYFKWLLRHLNKNDKQIIFINAWNEWAEGAIMEPTAHQGYAILNRTNDAIKMTRHKKSFEKSGVINIFGVSKKDNTELAVVLHVYYSDQWDDIKKRLNANLKKGSFDLFITLSKHISYFEHTIKSDFPNSNVKIVPNMGRDILPFIFIADRLNLIGYKYLLKIHTKKSKHMVDGEKWNKDLLDNLLPGKMQTNRIIRHLKNKGGIVGPKGHYISLNNYIGANEDHLARLLADIKGENISREVMNHKDRHAFIAGSMFWSSLEYLKPIFNLNLIPEDFEIEAGQVDGTVAHALERLMSLHDQDGDKVYLSSKWRLVKANKEKSENVYKYAPRG